MAAGPGYSAPQCWRSARLLLLLLIDRRRLFLEGVAMSHYLNMFAAGASNEIPAAGLTVDYQKSALGMQVTCVHSFAVPDSNTPATS